MADRLRILFVDDELPILEGLRRLLRSMRDEWEVLTANSGQAALAILEQEPVHVVVSDMRMPEMDGNQLLQAVRRLYPQTIRIVLSGHSYQENLLRASGPAQQYLNKPCELSVLKSAVERARALRVMIGDPATGAVLARITALPKVPPVYLRLLEVMHSSEPTLARISEVIAHNLELSTLLRKLVNSPLYGLNAPITSEQEVISTLGIETVRMVILAMQIVDHTCDAGTGGIKHEVAWRHSLIMAHLARAIAVAEHQSPEICDGAFTAGFMHDCGQLILAHAHAETYRLVIAATGSDLEATEHRYLGTTHSLVGGYLLTLWELPDALIEAAIFHHRPHECPAIGFTPLTAVHIADALAQHLNLSPDKPHQISLSRDYLNRVGIIVREDTWLALAKDIQNKVEAL